MNIQRTPNAALVTALLAAASVGEYKENGQLSHGLITTANASLFTQAHFSEPMTNYAIGWKDAAGYEQMSEFLAPALPAGGQRYEHIEYSNAEAFLSDGSYDDLRAINSEFKTVEYTSTKDQRTIPNRGLRIVLDYDKIKEMPNWQQVYTEMLLQRIRRNAWRRKMALAVASATNAGKTWGSSADPDYDVADAAKTSGDSSGIQPNRVIFGLSAKTLRFYAYGSQATAGAFGGRVLSPEEAMQKIGLQALVDESRYQSGTSKAQVTGALVLLFSAYGSNGMDPSNFKSAIGSTEQGGRYAVYVRQIGVKFWEITVETYETEFCASTLGVRTLTIS